MAETLILTERTPQATKDDTRHSSQKDKSSLPPTFIHLILHCLPILCVRIECFADLTASVLSIKI